MLRFFFTNTNYKRKLLRIVESEFFNPIFLLKCLRSNSARIRDRPTYYLIIIKSGLTWLDRHSCNSAQEDVKGLRDRPIHSIYYHQVGMHLVYWLNWCLLVFLGVSRYSFMHCSATCTSVPDPVPDRSMHTLSLALYSFGYQVKQRQCSRLQILDQYSLSRT